MEPFDDIQIEEVPFFDFYEESVDFLEEGEIEEQKFFNLLNSSTDF